MKKYLTLVIVVSCLLLAGGISQATSKIKGKIVAVNTKQESILLHRKDRVEGYKLALRAEIKLNKNKADLEALRPINSKLFSRARILLTDQGRVKRIWAYYRSVPVVITDFKQQIVVVKTLFNQQTRKYHLKPEVKLLRNNYSISASKLKVGDRGVAILGFEGRLQKLKVHHYHTTGLVRNNY